MQHYLLCIIVIAILLPAGEGSPVMGQPTKQAVLSHWYGGLKYFFLSTDVRSASDSILSQQFIKQSDLNIIVGQHSALAELDNRDNVFTPDKGMKFHIDAMLPDNFLSSDYDDGHMNYYAYGYNPFAKKLVAGLRIDGQHAFGDPPFFLLPFIDMRGVPAARYQGKADLLSEAEPKWDFVSLVLFGGVGTAFDQWSEFGSADWIATGGSGFRYLLARKFN